MSVSVPTSIDSGLSNGAAASATGAAATSGVPGWLPLILLGVTIVFLLFLLLRFGLRMKARTNRE